MKDVLQMFKKPWSPVVDTFAGSFSLDKTCMLLPIHRIFIGFKVDPSCVSEVMPQLVSIFISWKMMKGSDFGGEEELSSSAKVYVKVVEAIEVQVRLDASEVLKSFPFVQTLLRQILCHQSTYFGREELFRKARNIAAK